MKKRIRVFLGIVLSILVSSLPAKRCVDFVLLPEPIKRGPAVQAERDKMFAKRDNAEKAALRSMGEGEEYVEREFGENKKKRNRVRELFSLRPFFGIEAFRDPRLSKKVIDDCSKALIERGICPEIVEMGCCEEADAQTYMKRFTSYELYSKGRLDAGAVVIQFNLKSNSQYDEAEQLGFNSFLEYVIKHEATHAEQVDSLRGVLGTEEDKVDPSALKAYQLEKETVADLLPLTNDKPTAIRLKKHFEKVCHLNPSLEIDDIHLHPCEASIRADSILRAWEADEAEAERLKLSAEKEPDTDDTIKLG